MKCEICGTDSGDKPLCLSCWRKTKDGEFTRCEKCGTWKKDSKPVCISCWKKAGAAERNALQSKAEAQEKKPRAKTATKRERPKDLVSRTKDAVARTLSTLVAPEEDRTLCAVCGQNSKGKPLCYDCYQRSLDGEITQCAECGTWKNNKLPFCRECWEAKEKARGDLDFRERYADEPKYRCTNGILVRSKAERDIANFLYGNDIRFRYEQKLLLGKVEVHPDFLLEDLDLVLEHWGMDDAKYSEKRRNKERLYREHKQRFVSTEKSDEYNINDALIQLLQPLISGKLLK